MIAGIKIARFFGFEVQQIRAIKRNAAGRDFVIGMAGDDLRERAFA